MTNYLSCIEARQIEGRRKEFGFMLLAALMIATVLVVGAQVGRIAHAANTPSINAVNR